MDFDALFPGRFLKAGLFAGKDVTLTIKNVQVERMPKDGGGEEVKGIVSFEERELQLVLNKTNGLCFKEMFGRETNAWIGKRVTFYPADFEGEPCIRVRGSPDLGANKVFEMKLARKRAKRVTLIKTVAGKNAEPAHDPKTGEVIGDEPPPDVKLPTLADQPKP
jgi:hypothetical protein